MEESSRRRFARYVHVKNWNFLFYCSNIAKSENAMLWRMLSRLETCIVYSCIWSVTLAKSIVPRKPWQKLWHSYIYKLFLTKMQVKFSIFIHHGCLNVIRDKFQFVRSKLSIFSFSCLRRSVLIEHIANAWGNLLILLIVFCKIDKLTLLNTKLINTLNQNKLFSVHFHEMPGFKGKRKRGLTLTLYKKPFRYRLPVSPPRNEQKQAAVHQI